MEKSFVDLPSLNFTMMIVREKITYWEVNW